METKNQVAGRLRLVGYLRVSTDRQVEEGQGLDEQRASIERWAKVDGHEVAHWKSDEGVSGTKDAVERDGLREAVALVEAGEADGVVVRELGRLARLLHVQEATLALVWQAGGRAFTVDGGEVMQDDPDDPMRTAMRQMMGVFHQLERSMITKRLRDGRRTKHEKGGYAYGSPPYGYRSEDRELVPVPEEQEVIGRMKELRRMGRSYSDVARWLNRQGVTTKRGAEWRAVSVARVLDPEYRRKAADRSAKARRRATAV